MLRGKYLYVKDNNGSKIVVHSYSVFQPESYLCKFIYSRVTWPDFFLKDCML